VYDIPKGYERISLKGCNMVAGRLESILYTTETSKHLPRQEQHCTNNNSNKVIIIIIIPKVFKYIPGKHSKGM
jgi:hypothetical protein